MYSQKLAGVGYTGKSGLFGGGYTEESRLPGVAYTGESLVQPSRPAILLKEQFLKNQTVSVKFTNWRLPVVQDPVLPAPPSRRLESDKFGGG